MGCEPEMTKKKSKAAAPRKLNLPVGVPPLTSLYMYISGSCNLACRHCWIEPDYQADNKNGKFLKLEHVKKAIREAKPLGLQSVKLTGGEPMIHPRFREIVDYIESQGIGIVLETNGILIDNEIARFLKSKKHVSFVSVSLDGANADTHERLRGVKGSFRKAVCGIQALVKAGFKPQVICTLHKGNVAELEEVVRLAARLRCGSVKFNHVQHMGRGDDFAARNGIKVKELIRLFRKTEEKYPPGSGIRVHFDIPVAFSSIKKLVSGSQSRCHVFNILGIIANGDISLCGVGVTVPELVFGNLGRDRLKAVWTGSPQLRRMRRLVPDKFEGICGRCLHRLTCLGSCIANNYHTGKKFNAPYFFCREAAEKGIFPSARAL